VTSVFGLGVTPVLLGNPFKANEKLSLSSSGLVSKAFRNVALRTWPDKTFRTRFWPFDAHLDYTRAENDLSDVRPHGFVISVFQEIVR
jgi:hypothetical protein